MMVEWDWNRRLMEPHRATTRGSGSRHGVTQVRQALRHMWLEQQRMLHESSRHAVEQQQRRSLLYVSSC